MAKKMVPGSLTASTGQLDVKESYKDGQKDGVSRVLLRG